MNEVTDSDSSPFNPLVRTLLVVLSGPSGVGKDAVLNRMKESDYQLHFITTVTTRTQRPNERDNIDYHFISPAEYQQMIASDQLLESANVYGNWYGVPREAVKQALDSGQDVIVKVDVRGAASIKKLLPQAVVIFLTPPAMEDLHTRLKGRRTESPEDLTLRLETAKQEMKRLPLFDYVVVNRWDKVDETVSAVKTIIAAEKCRIVSRETAL
jgi:guanylate kinase